MAWCSLIYRQCYAYCSEDREPHFIKLCKTKVEAEKVMVDRLKILWQENYGFSHIPAIDDYKYYEKHDDNFCDPWIIKKEFLKDFNVMKYLVNSNITCGYSRPLYHISITELV